MQFSRAMSVAYYWIQDTLQERIIFKDIGTTIHWTQKLNAIEFVLS